MIVLSLRPENNSYRNEKTFMRMKKSFGANDVSDLLNSGDKALNENRFTEALEIYKKAGGIAPDNTAIYRKLGKTYFYLKDYKNSIANYEKYLQKETDDSESWIELGRSQNASGLYQGAIKSYEQALKLDNSNDMARRSILETKNNIAAMNYPKQAYEEKQEYAEQNLKTALDLTLNYMGAEYMQGLKDVKIVFGQTATMGGTSNIAQYENNKKTITVSNQYIYAAPQVIAAYLAHEAVHAKDADAYTSIREEQDAYEIAAKFWSKNSGGVKDPEMDYAVDLYKKSPSALRNRVAEIYKLRDPSIAKTSPNHPPSKKTTFKLPISKAANQSIKPYDVIA